MTPDDFLRSILADPADELPRLAYADWLEERGDPQAEVIRALDRLARTAPEQRRPSEGIVREMIARLGDPFAAIPLSCRLVSSGWLRREWQLTGKLSVRI